MVNGTPVATVLGPLILSVATLSRNFQESFVKPLIEQPDVYLGLRVGQLDELLVRLERSPSVYSAHSPAANHVRMRISPDIHLAIGMNVLSPDDQSLPVEMLACRHPGAAEMDAYERVLGDALHGDATLFAREDYVEEAWRIVDPALAAAPPVLPYAPGSWGPAAAQPLAPGGGWHDPTP